MHAYIYARWSTQEQTKGSTLERQIANATAMIVRRSDWSLVGTVTDEGRSAYTGANIETGNLGKFARRVQTGELDGRDTVLVVEELDRLSRQDVLTMLGWMTPLLATGLTIAIAKTGQIITQQTLASDMSGFMMTMVTGFGNNAESKKKAERVAAAWRSKRDRLREGHSVVRNHRKPLWIDIQDGAYRLNPLRARLVREIFALHLSGWGKASIATAFNTRALTDPEYRAWGECGKKQWDATYIGRVLHGIAAIGYWQPYQHPRGGKRVPDGKPIKLYPAAVDDDAFNRVNDRHRINQMKHQGRGRAISNLLGSKARCEHCGGVMDALGSSRYRTNKDGTTSRHYFLYCRNTKQAKTCAHHRGWTYDRIEKPLLDALLTRAMDDQHFSNDNDTVHLIEAEVFQLRRSVDDLTKGARAILKMVRLTPEDALLASEYADATAELNAERERLNDASERLAEARGKVQPSEHIRRVNEVRSLMDSADPDERYHARARVKAALQAIIEKMTFDDGIRPDKNFAPTVTVHLIGGVGTLYLREDGTVFEIDWRKRGRTFSAEDADALNGYMRRHPRKHQATS